MSRLISRVRAAGAAIAVALSVLALTTSPAAAGGAYLILYSDTAFSQPTNSITYESCSHFIGTVPGRQVGSFDNNPPADCRVVLHSTNGDFELCRGRNVVPALYSRVLLYSILTGTTVPCRSPFRLT